MGSNPPEKSVQKFLGLGLLQKKLAVWMSRQPTAVFGPIHHNVAWGVAKSDCQDLFVYCMIIPFVHFY